ncbi:hypothetical protein Y032_0048g1665 [Ancylostoma ceylanicum]|uniref:Uncharacterized protein n=1 Tax=Ancylostoma ceylanicum TaxID=53326 RepID=A0A016UBJ4_9BILA|nr:hypothetical protein Y032_0048g1665 [Ancylostoma ceylanicum]
MGCEQANEPIRPQKSDTQGLCILAPVVCCGLALDFFAVNRSRQLEPACRTAFRNKVILVSNFWLCSASTSLSCKDFPIISNT